MNVLTFLTLSATLLFASCSKEAEAPIAEKAKVQSIRFPCGPSCSSSAWLMETESGAAYEPVNLPPAFQQNELPVAVTFERTGKTRPAPEGSGRELIRIVQITRR